MRRRALAGAGDPTVPRRRGLAAAAVGTIFATWLVAPGPASAHGIVQRADVPIPEWLFGWAAAAVLVVSFIMLAAFWPEPKLEGDRGGWRPLTNAFFRGITSKPVEILAGAFGAFLLGVTLWAGFAGVQTPAANFSVTFVYVIFWNGLVLVCLLFGDWFRWLNPWRATAKVVAWVAEKAAGQPMPASLKYPDKFGYWPAAIGLFLFAVLELVVDDGNLPRNVAIGALIYSVLTWVGMLLYGIDAWLDRGEAFSVYFNLFSRVSPFSRREGVVGIEKPLAGLAQFKAGPGIVVFVAVMIGGVTFDGFKEGPVFTNWSVDMQDFFKDIGLSPKSALELANFAGLVLCVGVIFLFYRLGVEGAKSVGGGFRAQTLAWKFIHTLVPIAFAYVAAHYMTQLLFQSQALAYLASDPLGHGWNLFGGKNASIDFGIIGATATWYWQVGFVVVGHVLGLTLAHDRALAMYDDARLAVRSQYWMLGVMVGFTCLALWLLSQANS